MQRRHIEINLADHSVQTRTMTAEEATRQGRYLIAKTLLEEGVATVDPLSPANPLIFSAGPFAGSSFSNANRTSVGCKSPLTGGIGSDTFVFNSPLNAVDTITGFEANGNDRIELDNDVFLAFGATTGVLAAGNFASNAGGIATDANDFILFDTVTGNLYYDSDGNGGTQRILIANLTVAPGTIDLPDIFIV